MRNLIELLLGTAFVVVGCGRVSVDGEGPAKPKDTQAEVPERRDPTPAASSRPARPAESDEARVERVFSEEAHDSAWSVPTERTLMGALATMQEAKLQKLDCRTTICKMTFSLVTSDTSRLKGLYYDALRGIDLLNLTSTTFIAKGTTAVIYQTRQGYGFPFPDGSPNPFPPQEENRRTNAAP